MPRPDYDSTSLTRHEQTLMDALTRANGEWVTTSDLAFKATGYRDPSAQNVIRIHICHIRKKVGPGVVISKTGRGYRLAQP